jgi:beta-lactamase class A
MRPSHDHASAALAPRLVAATADLPAGAIGVSAYDYLSGRHWRFNGDRWFHAASVMKIAVLLGLFDAVAQRRFTLDCRLHVRNRFLSVVDRTPYRVDASRDGDAAVHAAIGRTLRLHELAQHMIVTSSNLATNLLLDLITPASVMATLQRLGIDGIDVRRGVEDDRAFAHGISNRVTPDGVVALLRAILDRQAISGSAADAMIEILHDQQFTGTIAPGLPEPLRAVARVAHKTGEISSVSHDAGIVFLPGRPPYAVAILVESAGDARPRIEAGIDASSAIYECIAVEGEAVSR